MTVYVSMRELRKLAKRGKCTVHAKPRHNTVALELRVSVPYNGDADPRKELPRALPTP